MFPIGSTVRVWFPEKDNEEFGKVKSEPFFEAGWEWVWVDFGHCSYTVTVDRLIQIKD